MKILDLVEQSMERLMEGTIGSVLRQNLQPAEIGRKLEREMMAKKRASVGSTIVPNAYMVRLHPRDFAQFSGWVDGLSRQMESWLAQYASNQRVTVLDRITVQIEESDKARRRQPIVEGTIADAAHRHAERRPPSQPAPVHATQAFRPPDSTQSASIRLRIVSGPLRGAEFPLRSGTTYVGRSSENDIVIDASDVSRRHARIDFDGRTLRVEDLNSTNGTRVNGDAVRIADVFPGDTIIFGGQQVHVDHAHERQSTYGRR